MQAQIQILQTLLQLKMPKYYFLVRNKKVNQIKAKENNHHKV